MPNPEPASARRRLPRRLPYWLFIIGLGVLVVFAWTQRRSGRYVAPGTQAPAFSARTLDGDSVTLEDYAGSVILLNVWATWCPPCREEMPSMERLYRYYQDSGRDFRILAVSVDAQIGLADEKGNLGGDLQSFKEEFDLTFTILHDPSGDIQRIYQTTGVPESFIIDREGVIRRRLAGATDWDTPEYRALIDRLLDGSQD